MNQKFSETGLTEEEVQERIKAGKTNQIHQKGSLTVGSILRHNILNLFNLVNVLLAMLVLYCGSPKNALFMGVVISNALIGSVQELRAKRMTDRLTLLSCGKVRVIRDGKETDLEKEELVEDDLLLLHAGDQIPVDGRILWGRGQANEALLTGESDPVEKKKGEILLSGSYLLSGHLCLRATAVGEKAYAARIAAEAQKYRKPISQIGRTLGLILYAAMGAIPILGGGLFWKQIREGIAFREAAVHTVASVIGMIPSGLVLLSTTVLCVGALRLGKKKALVREYACLETLARVDVLCLDKTGTLTVGRMKALEPIPFPGVEKEKIIDLMALFAACSPDRNPTLSALREDYPFCKPLPEIEYHVDFSAFRRYSAVSFRRQDNLPRTLILGAAERLCPDLPGELQRTLKAAYSRGERVVMLAESQEDASDETLPAMTPLALFPLKDVLRPEANAILEEFRQNGVEIKLISGDSPETVKAVAKEAGIQSKGSVDCSTLTEGQEDEIAEKYSVFGRVSPETKRRLIKALQKHHTVAMVGDGVNDVPALHQADVSVAMAGGSQAASDVAKIVLADGDFSAMRKVLYEGRRAVNNVERSATLYLGKTVYTLLLTLILLFAPGKYPFQPIQLTLISVFTIGIPSVVLGLEPNREKIKGKFLPNVLRSALPAALIILGSILCAMLLTEPMKLTDTQGSTLTVLAAANAGLTVLFHTARPFNFLRGLLTAAMAAGLYGAVLLMPEFFSLIRLPWYADFILLLLAVGMTALYPLLKRLIGRIIG